jgi:phage repressor protein C with HTH and peptisase S24 domain
MILFLEAGVPAGDRPGERPSMFTHAEMWRGIDNLAKHHGLTPSGLARRAGLDPTTFNPSKRITKQDKTRWPSTESLAKILTATGTSLQEFVTMVAGEEFAEPSRTGMRIPCIALDQTDRRQLFDAAGFAVGDQWDEVEFPNLEDRHAYALEVRGDVLQPFFRDGDILIVSPAADVRRHDRIVVRLVSGNLLAGTLRRRSAQRIEITMFASEGAERTLTISEVDWLARIVWASQ